MFEENFDVDEAEYDKYFTDDDLLDIDYNDVTEDQENLAYGIMNILQDIIDDEEATALISEQFLNDMTCKRHFERHCVGGKRFKNHKSTRSDVYYDFLNITDYGSHENDVDIKIKNTKYIIKDILDTKTLLKLLSKIFEGNICVKFSTSCGLQNKYGRISLAVNSWATSYKENYMNNTLDFVVQTPAGTTLTIFPVDANYFENKLNNELTNNGFPPIKLNH